jgi:hypothetical protein
VKKMVSTAMPLLRAGGQCRKIILTPTSRYRDCPCCGAIGHCTNMKDRNFKQWMDGRLAEVRGLVKDYVRMRNIKRATIISLDQLITPTAGLSEYLQQEELRGGDPVHYTPKGYSLAAAGLEALIYQKRGEEKEAEEKAERQLAKKAKFDLTKKRPDWVKGSVSEAVRSSEGTSGNWRGNKVPRGAGQKVWRGGGSGGAYGGRDVPTVAAAVASAAAEAAMTAVAVAGVLRQEAEEETGAADTGAGAEAALGESEL